MTTPAERKALNEATFRDANETLEQRAQELVDADDEDLVPFLCECPTLRCTQVVLLRLDEYAHVRARPEQGLAALGHEDLSIERVVSQNERCVLTAKMGLAGEMHRETDPRG